LLEKWNIRVFRIRGVAEHLQKLLTLVIYLVVG
jgi:hypothetical protein